MSESRLVAFVAIALVACVSAAPGTARQLLAPTDPGSYEAGLQYYVGQMVMGAQYVEEGLAYVDQHYDFPTDGVVNGKVLSGKADKLGDAAEQLLTLAEDVYPEPAFPFPNGTSAFWSAKMPTNEEEATWVGLLAAGRGLSMLVNSISGVVEFPELVAETINAGLANEVKTLANTTREIIANIVVAFMGGLDKMKDINSTLLLSSVANILPAQGGETTTAGRKLLADDDKDKCSIDFMVVNEYSIDDVKDCTFKDMVAALEDLDAQTTKALKRLEDGAEDVWKQVTGTSGKDAVCSDVNFKGTATAELLEYLRDDEQMRPCGDLGCHECAQAKGGRVVLDDCSRMGDDKQQWKWEDADEPGVDMFRIKNDEEKKCITAEGKEGEKVYLSDCKKPAGPKQTFQAKEVESQGLFRDPYYSVMHASSGLCMGLEENDDKEGMTFVLGECKCEPRQIFKADD